MRMLDRCDLERVKPRFRPLVEAAWARGEEVPWAVVLLDDRELTAAEKQRGRELRGD
jgi:hypothetical protein